MKRKRGRPRKAGRRLRSGRLVGPSPREVAAGMPHRRGLGEDAASQLGENELGRLILKGQLEPLLGLAGEYFAGAYWGYVATLGGPARGGGDGGGGGVGLWGVGGEGGAGFLHVCGAAGEVACGGGRAHWGWLPGLFG